MTYAVSHWSLSILNSAAAVVCMICSLLCARKAIASGSPAGIDIVPVGSLGYDVGRSETSYYPQLITSLIR